MVASVDPVDGLLEKAGCGDLDARQELLAHHRDRLRRMVAMRMDARLAARVDASDVVQDTLMDADRKLAEFLRSRPLPFYAWLRRLALGRIIVHRQHLGAGCRTAALETMESVELNDESHERLADRLVCSFP
jgi:RNA polymerase sigma-70 factor, ECF subfamily